MTENQFRACIIALVVFWVIVLLNMLSDGVSLDLPTWEQICCRWSMPRL